MIYEVGISYISIDEKGNEKRVKDLFLIHNASTFSDVENLVTVAFGQLKEFDVYQIKRSRIMEIANTRSEEGDKVFVAQIADVFIDEDGVSKDINYNIALFSTDMDSAHAFIREYMNQGYDMELKSLKETKIAEVLNA